MDHDVAWLTARGLAAAVAAGDLSAEEVVDGALQRAQTVGAEVGAFVTLAPELARSDARRWGDGAGARAPFAGVPLGVKDLSLVAGVPMRAGSAALEPFVPEEDDGAVRLLREAGCAVVGTTATPELGLPCYTEPDVGPTARTPWDLSRSAGGSSGGSAAAVAAGVVPVALGGDGGGSIRIPASACGVVGLKPSRGRISWGPLGVDRSGLATLAVVTRDVRDTAAFLDVLSAPWPGDLFHLPPPRTTFLDACDRPPGRLRVGVLTTPVIAEGAPVHPACLAAVERVAAVLTELGHDVGPAPVPFAAERWEGFRALWTAGAASVPLPPEAEERLVPLTRWLREAGRDVTGVAYADAVAGVQTLAREVAAAWAGFDVILTPTLAQPPAPVGSQRDDADPAGDFEAQKRFTPWTSIWNLTGDPAISLPLHWARVGGDGPLLPIGVQLGGRACGEETLLALSAQLEEALPWRDRRPPVTPPPPSGQS